MEFNKALFSALKTRIQSQTNTELRVTPAPELPTLIMDSLKYDAVDSNQSQTYNLTGSLSLIYLAEFKTETEFLNLYDKINSIIVSVHKEQKNLVTLQPTLKLTRIDFSNFSQEILTEEAGDKVFSQSTIDFTFQIF